MGNERQKIEKQLESARLINEKLSIRLKENETRDNLLREKKEEVEKTIKDSEEDQILNEVAVIAKAAVEQARVREVSLLKELELARNEVTLSRSEFSGSSNISIVSGANEGRRKLRREDNMYDD